MDCIVHGVTESVKTERLSLVAQTEKNLPLCERHGLDPLVRKIPWRREWQSTPVCLPGESHGQRSLAGYNPASQHTDCIPDWLHQQSHLIIFPASAGSSMLKALRIPKWCWDAVSVKPRALSLLYCWEQDRVPSILVLSPSLFKQGVCLPHLVQHMSCKTTVNRTKETQEMNTLRYNPPDSAKSAGVARDSPPVKVGIWRRRWQPTPIFLLGEPHGQRSLAGWSPWGPKELDTTEQLN